MPGSFYPYGPISVRNATFTRVRAIPGLANVFNKRTMPTQEDQLPCALVYLVTDRTTPLDAGNTGAPSFHHRLTLVVDVLTKAGSEDALDASITGFVETIRETLLCDPAWVAMVEGIEACDTEYGYAKESAFPMAQGQIRIEATFASTWEPDAPAFETVDITTPGPDGQPIETVITLPQ